MTLRDGKLEFTTRELALGHIPPWAFMLYLLYECSKKLDAILAILSAHK